MGAEQIVRVSEQRWLDCLNNCLIDCMNGQDCMNNCLIDCMNAQDCLNDCMNRLFELVDSKIMRSISMNTGLIFPPKLELHEI